MIKFNLGATACVALSIFAPALSYAQIKKSGGGYLLRMKYKAGVVRKYSVATTIKGLPAAQVQASKDGTVTFDGPVIDTIKSVTGKVATVEMSTGPFTMAGATVGQAESRTFQVDELGDMVATSEEAGFGVKFPKEAVKVGGTWKQSMAIPGTMGSQGNAKAVFRFNGIKAVGKQRLADVSFSIAPFAGIKNGVGHAMLSPVDGSLVSMTLTFAQASPQAGAADLNISITVKPAS